MKNSKHAFESLLNEKGIYNYEKCCGDGEGVIFPDGEHSWSGVVLDEDGRVFWCWFDYNFSDSEYYFKYFEEELYDTQEYIKSVSNPEFIIAKKRLEKRLNRKVNLEHEKNRSYYLNEFRHKINNDNDLER